MALAQRSLPIKREQMLHALQVLSYVYVYSSFQRHMLAHIQLCNTETQLSSCYLQTTQYPVIVTVPCCMILQDV